MAIAVAIGVFGLAVAAYSGKAQAIGETAQAPLEQTQPVSAEDEEKKRLKKAMSVGSSLTAQASGRVDAFYATFQDKDLSEALIAAIGVFPSKFEPIMESRIKAMKAQMYGQVGKNTSDIEVIVPEVKANKAVTTSFIGMELNDAKVDPAYRKLLATAIRTSGEEGMTALNYTHKRGRNIQKKAYANLSAKVSKKADKTALAEVQAVAARNSALFGPCQWADPLTGEPKPGCKVESFVQHMPDQFIAGTFAGQKLPTVNLPDPWNNTPNNAPAPVANPIMTFTTN